MTADAPRTLARKIWDNHVVVARSDGYCLLYVDRHFLNDGSGPRRAFEILNERGLAVRHPERTVAAADHHVSTAARTLAAIADPERRAMVEAFDRNAAAHGIAAFGLNDPRQGIAHIVGPEQGLTLPGMLVVCNDSHTATHGGMGALGFGIGASEACHVLATQTLWQRAFKTMRITVDHRLASGVSAKDLILAIIARIGAAGANGYAIEYAGSAVGALSVEGRLTLCNMSIEAGARVGLVAPDDVTLAYLADRPFAPSGPKWDEAVASWRALPSDPDAVFDREVSLDGAAIAPMVTWGTSPEHAMPVTERVPDPDSVPDASRRAAMERALAYMALAPGTDLTEVSVDRIFIGSCTNGRLSDLQAAARILRGRKIAPTVRAMAVPGSLPVKVAAEAEGLDKIFTDAGFSWHEPGCSMCIGVNGDLVGAGERCVSTSNRNFVGRQGFGARTHLTSPAMAAAAAVAGRFVDVRAFAPLE